MSLPAGSRLGLYDILSPLGAGGMGEVYRAKDTTLGRDVALKILPGSFTNDPETHRTIPPRSAGFSHPLIIRTTRRSRASKKLTARSSSCSNSWTVRAWTSASHEDPFQSMNRIAEDVSVQKLGRPQ